MGIFTLVIGYLNLGSTIDLKKGRSALGSNDHPTKQFNTPITIFMNSDNDSKAHIYYFTAYMEPFYS
jgi:hypothetical protein